MIERVCNEVWGDTTDEEVITILKNSRKG